jgi:peroxiredoxin
MKRKFLFILLLVMLLMPHNTVAFFKGKAEVGQTAPDFILKDIDGNTHRLSDYRGKIVMIYFAMWCGVCRANSYVIEKEFYEKYHDKGIEVFALDYLKNKKEDLKPIIKDLDIKFKTLIDDGSMKNSYNGTMAMTIVIDREGIIRYKDFYNKEKVEDVVKILLGLKKEPEKKEDTIKIPEGGITIFDSEKIKRRFRHSIYYGQSGTKATGYFLQAVKLDLNNDGYDDVVYNNTFDKGSKGAVYVHYGSKKGPSKYPDIIIHGEQNGDSFGYSINGGDINGDGFIDLIVGAVQAGSKGTGKVYVFNGSKNGITKIPSLILKGLRKGEWFGFSTAICDMNSDGYKDLIIGARLNDIAAKEAGAIYVFYGRQAGYSGEPDMIITGEEALDYFGVSLACLDVNKDGLDDIIVGAPGHNGRGVDRGRVYVFYGRKNLPDTSLKKTKVISSKEADTKITGETNMGNFGARIAAIGDINGDSLKDFAASAYDAAGNSPGNVYVFLGGRQIPTDAKASDAGWVIKGETDDAMFGCPIAGIGDIDGDGIDDFVIGSNAYKKGAVYIYRGSKGGKFDMPAMIIYGWETDWKFGNTVAPAGDINGDGKMDFLIGEPWNSEKGEKVGAIYLYY